MNENNEILEGFKTNANYDTCSQELSEKKNSLQSLLSETLVYYSHPIHLESRTQKNSGSICDTRNRIIPSVSPYVEWVECSFVGNV